MKRFSNLILTSLLVAFTSHGITSQEAFGEVAYTAIGARKPTDSKAKQITFVACRIDGVLAKYKGPRRDVGAAKFISTLTAKKAKNLIKLPKSRSTSRATNVLLMSRALSKGKIIYSTKKNITSLNSQIDACVPTKTATGTGSWVDEARSTTGNVNMNVTVDRSARTLTIETSVTGFPLGVVDAANIPPETQVVSIPAGETSAPISFASAFVPGDIAGTASIDETKGTFSASGTATHNSGAEGFEGSTANWTATGPLTGSSVGSITITGDFPAGGNSFTISTNTNSSSSTSEYCKKNPEFCKF